MGMYVNGEWRECMWCSHIDASLEEVCAIEEECSKGGPYSMYNKEDSKPVELADLDFCEAPEDCTFTLSYEDGKKMLEALQRPAKPNQKLMEALVKHKGLTDEHL